jgi:hypothetical protein
MEGGVFLNAIATLLSMLTVIVLMFSILQVSLFKLCQVHMTLVLDVSNGTTIFELVEEHHFINILYSSDIQNKF